MKKAFLSMVMVFFATQLSFSQLSNFTLTVTKTNETCLGNGTLNFTVSGTTPGSTIVYTIYKLPNTTTPIAVLSTNTFTGLNAGTYRVIATQSLGGSSGTQQQDITINNMIVPIVFNIVGTDEHCHDGSITVNVTQGTPATYEIVSGPVVVAPQTSNVFNNLQAGTYNIRVIDNCGEGYVQTYTIIKRDYFTVSPFNKFCQLLNCNTITGSFTVSAYGGANLIYPITVLFTYVLPGGSPVSITQTIASGDALNLAVQQNLPYALGTYNYNIRVTDPCGNNVFSLGSFNVTNNLNLSPNLPTMCKQINVSLCDYLPPLTVNFLSAPAGFNPSTFNSIHPGPFNSDNFSYTSTTTNHLPVGDYTIQVTDACGRTRQNTVTIQDYGPTFLSVPDNTPCGDLSMVFTTNPGPLLTSVIMTSAPSVYVHTMPYDVSSYINNGGVFIMNLPSGTYTFTTTNVCGEVMNHTLVVPPRTVIVNANGSSSSSCNLGFVKITSIGGNLSSIIMTQAPAGFSQPLPYDVSSFIFGSVAIIPNLIPGNYTFIVVDSCGGTHNPITATVSYNPILTEPTPIIKQGCDIGYGTLSFNSPNGSYNQVIITAAPTTFAHTLPYDVSFNITSNFSANTGFANDFFYMNSLPAGNYIFHTKDDCGIEHDLHITIDGYAEVANNVIIDGNCGSFDLSLEYTTNDPVNLHTFWLQKYNSATGQWEHPITGVQYTAGTVPTTTNSYQLLNYSTNFNIASQGTFRVITSFSVYSNGSPIETYCNNVIKTFNFSDGLRIDSVYGIPCTAGATEVVINATGIAPLTYSITSFNGSPLLVNNGAYNVFSNLQPGIYNFQVRDLCGNIVNSLLDITTIPLPQIVPSTFCEGQNGQLTVQNFPNLNYQWWKGTNTTTILSTTNILNFTPFLNATTPGTYYVRIYSLGASCADKILSIVINPVALPNAGQNNTLNYCGNQGTVNLNNLIIGTYDAGGTWQEITTSGMLSNNLWNSTSVATGTYQFKYTVNNTCGNTDDSLITITIKPTPSTPVASSNSPLCQNQTLNLFATTVTNATYQWSGPNGFTSTLQNPTIASVTSANAGSYSVKAIINGCESAASSTTVAISSINPPNAGQDNTLNYCGNQGTINLNNLIVGTYDAGGTWQEITTSGMLSSNLWNSTSVAYGTYQFKYVVNGSCGTVTDDSLITITIKEIPQTPVASVNPIICDTQNLELFATSIPNVTYSWTGPNGFTSTQQNPIISPVSSLNSGTYSVKVTKNGCDSGVSTVNVVVNSLPQFSIAGACTGNNYIITATPTTISAMTLNWTGPNGYSNNVNPITITGLPNGVYSLTVTDANGCSTTNSIDVASTMCEIPKGISPNGDGNNDTFNLTGFDVKKIKIFNRYGMVVYELEDYLDQWHGQSKNGSILPSGTYYYYIELGTGEARTGWVYLALSQ